MNRKRIAQLLIVASASCASFAATNKEVSATVLHNKEIKLPKDSIAKGQVINVSTNLRIRKDSNINSSIVGYMVNGETFIIKNLKGDWYEIEQGNKKGYIYKDYVKKLDSNNVPSHETLNNNTSSTKPNNSNQSEKVTSSSGQVINISTSLRVRQAPNTSSATIGYLTNGVTVSVKEKSGSWYKIAFNGSFGYVHADYIKILNNTVSENNNNNASNTNNSNNKPAQNNQNQQNKTGIVYDVSTNLRLRTSPSTSNSSTTLAYMLPNEKVTILSLEGDWYKVNYNGKIGYASKQYIKPYDNSNNSGGSNSNTNNNTSNNSNSTVSGNYNDLIIAMQSQLGTPYVFGGAGESLTSDLLERLKKLFPTEAARGIYNVDSNFVNKGYKAFDCSGLMQWGFKQIGINIGRTTWDQVTNGSEVSLNNLKPGDLIFYSNLNHVGMYIGNGQWIESPNSRGTVKVSQVPWNKVSRARRILK